MRHQDQGKIDYAQNHRIRRVRKEVIEIMTGEASKVQVGDQLRLGCSRSLVMEVHHYNSFREMLIAQGYEGAVPDANDLHWRHCIASPPGPTYVLLALPLASAFALALLLSIQ